MTCGLPNWWPTWWWLFAHATDSPATTLRKKLATGIATLLLASSLAAIRDNDDWFIVAVRGVAIAHCAASIVYVAATKQLPYILFLGMVTGFLILGICEDFYRGVTLQARCWPWILLLVDVQLLCRFEETEYAGLVWVLSAGLLVSMAIIAIEDTTRTGVYSFIGDPEDRCNCEHPPCQSSVLTTVRVFCTDAGTVVAHCAVAQFFHQSICSKRAVLQSTFTTTENIAEALSVLDLEAAQAILADSSIQLPDAMRASFTRILTTILVFKPYLPEAVFASYTGLSVSPRCLPIPKDVEAPGLHTSNAAIVFTDIKSSTATWDVCPDGMKRGLQIHNEVIRGVIAKYAGYEVKTIGDAFMAAFEGILTAVEFSLEVHEALYEAPWPAALLEVPVCSSVPDAWNGLRLRIGVNSGLVSVEKNVVVDRYDYFGHTVNKAARLEGCCYPGAVAVTRGSFEEIQEYVSCVVIPRGDVSLHGIGPCPVVLLVPSSLKCREWYVREQIVSPTAVAPTQRGSLPHSEGHRASNGAATTISRGLADEVSVGRMEIVKSATTGKVDIRLEHGCLPDELQLKASDCLTRILKSVDRSDGTVVSVLGSAVAVGWNVAQRCPAHVENAFRFVQLMHASIVGNPPPCSMHAGLCTGELYCGAIGGKGLRFITSLGLPVSLTGPLAGTASALNTLAVFCSTKTSSQDVWSGWREVMRPVKRWDVKTIADNDVLSDVIVVYQIGEKRMEDSKKHKGQARTADNTNDWGWSAAYWDAFETNDLATLRGNAGIDPVVDGVIVSLSKPRRHIYV
ncbi:Adenylate cyclase [Diplonema papillatum]|nr:Adenylate cyclase [Diplonema papillatum]